MNEEGRAENFASLERKHQARGIGENGASVRLQSYGHERSSSPFPLPGEIQVFDRSESTPFYRFRLFSATSSHTTTRSRKARPVMDKRKRPKNRLFAQAIVIALLATLALGPQLASTGQQVPPPQRSLACAQPLPPCFGAVRK